MARRLKARINGKWIVMVILQYIWNGFQLMYNVITKSQCTVES